MTAWMPLFLKEFGRMLKVSRGPDELNILVVLHALAANVPDADIRTIMYL